MRHRKKKGAMIMNSCRRCGDKLQHNYLVEFFKVTKEKRERMIVCLKCRDILKQQQGQSAASLAQPKNTEVKSHNPGPSIA
jgi:uncharacterized CHY-type Zn-finger protein